MSFKREKPVSDIQYQIVANEYISALQGAQTVIVINLAISIGILAAMTTMLATENYTSVINLITLIVLSNVGLLGTLCCILTLYVSREQLINLQKELLTYEKENNIKCIHIKRYYKPLHYTLFGFWVFTLTFMIVMSICLIKLIVPEMFGFLSVTITFIILALCLLGVVKLIDIGYVKKNKELTENNKKKDDNDAQCQG